jgi:serine/threonine protein kinase
MNDHQICSSCGGNIFPGDRFCAHCGAEQGAAAQAAGASMGARLWDPVLAKLRAATEGKYAIGRVLGTGGMAAVYLATEVRLNRPVAIKVMSPGLMMQPGMMERFRHEAITIAGLNHPNIITIYTVEETDDLHFFVMKYVPGPTLEKVIQRDGPLPRSVVRAWLTQVGSALGYAHRRGVVHRDVKPGNILLDDEGNAIVTDFGIAKKPQHSTLTHTGMTLGTPAYMSPEQCTSKDVTPSSDQYSLGIVAYEMLTGAPPFAGPSLEVMKAHVERAPIPIAERRPHCPAELVEAVERMLEKDPASRWPNLEEMIAALGGAHIGHDDPVRVQLAALAKPGAKRARLRVRGRGGVATVSPPNGEPSLPGIERPPYDTDGGPPSPAIGSPIVSPPAGQRRVTPSGGRSPVTPVPDFLEPTAPAPVDALVIASPPRSLWVGQTLRLRATALDAAGARLKGRAVSWSSSDPEVGEVTSDGAVTAGGPGMVTITANSNCEGASDSVRLEALPVYADAVKVRPWWRRVLAKGSTVPFTAVVRGSDGSRLGDRPVSWTGSDTGVIEVGADGAVTALAPGTAELTARCEERSATVSVRVTEPGPPFWVAAYWWTAPLAAMAVLVLWLALRPAGEAPEPGGEPIPTPVTRDSVAPVPPPADADPLAIDPVQYRQLAAAAREAAMTAKNTAIVAGAEQAYGLRFAELDAVFDRADSAFSAAGYALAVELYGTLQEDYDELAESARSRSANIRTAAETASGRATREQRSAQTAGAPVYFPSEFGSANRRLQDARSFLSNGRYEEAEQAFAGLIREYRSMASRARVRVARAGAEAARREADGQRQRAVAAGAEERAAVPLARITQLYYDPAVAQFSQGQYTNADASFDQAAARFGSLADSLLAAPAAEPEPVVVPSRPAAEAVPELVERLRVLFQQEDLDGIGRELYGGEIPEDDERYFRAVIDNADELRIRVAEPLQIEEVAGRATTEVIFSMDFVQSRGGHRRQDHRERFRLTFVLTDGAWRLADFDKP